MERRLIMHDISPLTKTCYVGVTAHAISVSNNLFWDVLPYPYETYMVGRNGKKIRKIWTEELYMILNNFITCNSVVLIEENTPRFQRDLGILEGILTSLTMGEPFRVIKDEWRKFYTNIDTNKELVDVANSIIESSYIDFHSSIGQDYTLKYSEYYEAEAFLLSHYAKYFY